MRAAICLVGVAGAIAWSAVAAAAGPETTLLSNETTLTRWAYPSESGVVYRDPSDSSPRITRLHPYTEDARPEVYLALRMHVDAEGQEWIEIRLPRRPNGQKGWVRRDLLGPLHTVRTQLRVNRGMLRATLYRGGRVIWTSPIGVGKPSTPTPAGHFYVRDKLTRYASPFYGPIAFGTSAYSTLSEWPKGGVVGIHGTSEPYLLPGHVSHGCIRVPNGAILRLARLMPIGTPVLIR
jgi:L,D-transpeptidase catalytic domain